MQNPDNWQINLSRKYSLAASLLLISLFACYEYLLCAPLLSSAYSDLSTQCLERARAAGANILASKALFYRDALRLLKAAIKSNRRDAQLYYNYARLVLEVAENEEISNAIGIRDIGARLEGKEGLYNLALIYCKRAIFKAPTNAVYHRDLGIIYDSLFDAKQAEKEFKNALLLDPENVEMRIYLMRYFLSRREEGKFLDYLNGAYALCGKRRENSGTCCLMLERFLREIKREGLIKNDPALPERRLDMKGRAG